MNATAAIELLALMRLQLRRAIENDVDALGAGFDGVVDDFAGGRCCASVSAAALRFQRLLRIEQGELEVIGQASEVFLLALDFCEKAVGHGLSPISWLHMAARLPPPMVQKCDPCAG